MANEIISHSEMCSREGGMLQRGMNFQRGAGHSIILMSLRPNAPYDDQLDDDGATLIYEGHNASRGTTNQDPARIDQPEKLPSGKLTENGKFHAAAQAFKRGQQPAERVRVYEKIKDGIWSYNGEFELVDSWRQKSGRRSVFKFRLHLLDEKSTFEGKATPREESEHSRVIPTAVKLAVWARDHGQCRVCGSTASLHFDHIIPYSKGGSSETADNIQILCGKHNLAKHDRIE
jgi:hypothetical protein